MHLILYYSVVHAHAYTWSTFIENHRPAVWRPYDNCMGKPTEHPWELGDLKHLLMSIMCVHYNQDYMQALNIGCFLEGFDPPYTCQFHLSLSIRVVCSHDTAIWIAHSRFSLCGPSWKGSHLACNIFDCLCLSIL